MPIIVISPDQQQQVQQAELLAILGPKLRHGSEAHPVIVLYEYVIDILLICPHEHIRILLKSRTYSRVVCIHLF